MNADASSIERGAGNQRPAGSRRTLFPHRVLLVALLAWVIPPLFTGADPAAALQEDAEGVQVVVVLKDGVPISGKLIAEDDDAITLVTPFGTSRIDRSKIKEIKRESSDLAEEWHSIFDAARSSKDLRGLRKAARFARASGLTKELAETYRAIIELAPEDEEARKGLGHARLDGAWLDKKAVTKKLAEGYVLAGLDLVPGKPRPGGGTQVPGGTGEITEIPEIDIQDRVLKRKNKKFETFKKQRRLEYVGRDFAKIKSGYKTKQGHYTILCNSTPEVMRFYGHIMEVLFSKLSRRIDFPDKRSGRSVIKIYRNHQEFMEVEGVPANIGGFYQRNSEMVTGYHGTFGDMATTLSVLAHEATHQFQGRKLGPRGMGACPNWLIEGMAVFFGDGSRIDPDRNTITEGLIPRFRLLHLQRKMREGTAETIQSLARIPRVNGSQYSDSWALFYYLALGPRKKDGGQEVITRLWKRAEDGTMIRPRQFIEMLEEYVGPIEELESEYREFVASLEAPALGEVDGDIWSSYDYKVELRRPNEAWEFVDDTERTHVLIQAIPEGSEIKVELMQLAKLNPLDDDVKAVNELFSSEAFNGRYTRLGAEARVLGAYEYRVFDYQDKPPKKPADDKKGDTPAKPEPGTPAPGGEGKPAPGKPGEAEAKKKLPRRYRAFAIGVVDRILVIRCSAPVDGFDSFISTMEFFPEHFTIVPKRRW